MRFLNNTNNIVTVPKNMSLLSKSILLIFAIVFRIIVKFQRGVENQIVNGNNDCKSNNKTEKINDRQQYDYDVIVYGSTPAGIAASIGASKLGMKVGLFEPLPMIGGMGAAGNLGLNDGGVNAERTGLAKEFAIRNGIYYYYNRTANATTISNILKQKGGPVPEVPHPESFVAEQTFYKMLNDANVHTIKLNCRLLSATADNNNHTTPSTSNSNTAPSTVTSNHITSIHVLCEKKPLSAMVFIDASYDGEIMVALGKGIIHYTSGRESISQYNESLAGVRIPSWNDVEGPRNIDALEDDEEEQIIKDEDANTTSTSTTTTTTTTTRSSKIIKYVANISQLGKPGDADDSLMAFQHRLCISSDTHRTPFPKPKGYHPNDFKLLQRTIDATFKNPNHTIFNHSIANLWLPFTRLPPPTLPGLSEWKSKHKFCLCCGISLFSSDQPMLNAGWSNASYEEKQQIIENHTYFELGSFYYLSHSKLVPKLIRTEFKKYGLCSDEFQTFNYIPPQLYVRISNRLIGDFVMTQNNLVMRNHDTNDTNSSSGGANTTRKNREDSIAVGNWTLDQHMTGKYAVPVQDKLSQTIRYEVMVEGNFWPSIHPNEPALNWYDVPFSIMVPQRGDVTNLLVPVCLSASAVAYSSVRIENMFMSIGTAAGVSAQQIVDNEAPTVQDINVTKVQHILVNTFHQRIHGPPKS